MKWITREKVKVDRVACPWLIENFVDPQAEFVFLPRDTDWGSIRDGTVYDVPGCELGRRNTTSMIPRFISWVRSFGRRTPTRRILTRQRRVCVGSPTASARSS